MVYIAVAITSTTSDQELKDIDLATSQDPDMIELRIDYLKDLNEHTLEKLLRHCKLPVVVTNRHKNEAGSDSNAGFRGSEDQRIGYLEQAIALGAEYVDIEGRCYRVLDKKKTQLIVSYHDFEKTPANLEGLYKSIKNITTADVIKFATKANSEEDVRRIIAVIEQANKDNIPIIGIGVGELGEKTRLHKGNYVTYACLTPEQASAPGQFTVAQLRERLG